MEELEIGDYINDINSYHLHMFDKHDVTTKKLDVIVEKAGKVDANYAAQIEGNLNRYIKSGLHRTVFWLITRMHGEKHHWKLLSKCRIGQVYWKG